LKNAVKAMFFNMRQNDLIAAVREGKSDGEIAKLAREAFAEK
jgi:DNA-binding NarL/FixJ family response regulator